MNDERLPQPAADLCSEEEIDRLVVLDVKPASYFWDPNEQHGGGSPRMARDPEVLGWLFAQ